jgi:hypothetical protein
MAAAGGELRFVFAARGCIEPHRASQMLPQRWRLHPFEPAVTIGTNDTNDKNSLH